MKIPFNLSEFRTVYADLDFTISLEIVDSRVPDNTFVVQGLTLEEYNDCIAFMKEHDHIYGMNMAKERFCK